MRAILMAAGIGSRLSVKPSKPKCLWELGGEPLIVKTIRMLTENGFDVHLIVGFKHEMIEEALRDYPVTFHYNPFFRVTNSLGSLWFAREALAGDEDTILGNADVYWEKPLLDKMLASDYDALMLGDVERVESGDYFFLTDENGCITDYGKQLPLERRTCEYVGLCRLKKEFIPGFRDRLDKLVNEEQYNLWWENVLYENCHEYPVHVLDVEGAFWGEIDYMQDYNRIQDYVNSKQK